MVNIDEEPHRVTLTRTEATAEEYGPPSNPRPNGLTLHVVMTDAAEARATFGRLVDIAASRLAHAPAAAAGWLQVAAHYAWNVNPGGMTSPRLESILHRLASTLPDENASRPADDHAVLHVATSLHGIGGHSRLLQNWIVTDDGHRHSVVVTDQRAALPPLVDSDGAHVEIHSLTGSLVDRATRLRALARDRVLILLHTDPHDVVPFLALPPTAASAKVLLVNHADHVFSVGLNNVDGVVHLRDAGRQLSVEYRGVSPDRALLLPLPMSPPSNERAPLPVPADRDYFVVATMAQSYKFGDPEDFYLPSVRELLSRADDCAAIVVGPEPRGPWAAAVEEFDGRLLVMGGVPDAARMLANADAFLDSAPLGSLTSALEVGLAGTPIATWRRADAHPVFTCDDPALTAVAAWVDTPVDAPEALLAWHSDRQSRLAAGEATAAAIRSFHVGADWRVRLHDVLGAANDLPARVPPDFAEDLVVPMDESLLWPLRATHQPPQVPHDLLFFLKQQRRFIGQRLADSAALTFAAGIRKLKLSSIDGAGLGQQAFLSWLGR